MSSKSISSEIDEIKNVIKTAITNNINVLLEGETGYGKTQITQSAIIELNKENLTNNEEQIKFLYFNTPTIDPYLDFVGIPVPKQDYFDFVRSENLVKNSPQVIILDELNRAPKKIINSLMELILYRSINGLKLDNLKTIIAMINPSNSQDFIYNVEYLDFATKDRFPIILKVPKDISSSYFKEKYGEISTIFVDWWKNLNNDQKNSCSPRRLEYAIMCYLKGIDIQSILSDNLNISKLIKTLEENKNILSIDEIVKSKNYEQAEKIASNYTVLSSVKEMIKNSVEYRTFFAPYVDEETLQLFLHNDDIKLGGIIDEHNKINETSNEPKKIEFVSAFDWNFLSNDKNISISKIVNNLKSSIINNIIKKVYNNENYYKDYRDHKDDGNLNNRIRRYKLENSYIDISKTRDGIEYCYYVLSKFKSFREDGSIEFYLDEDFYDFYNKYKNLMYKDFSDENFSFDDYGNDKYKMEYLPSILNKLESNELVYKDFINSSNLSYNICIRSFLEMSSKMKAQNIIYNDYISAKKEIENLSMLKDEKYIFKNIFKNIFDTMNNNNGNPLPNTTNIVDRLNYIIGYGLIIVLSQEYQYSKLNENIFNIDNIKLYLSILNSTIKDYIVSLKESNSSVYDIINDIYINKIILNNLKLVHYFDTMFPYFIDKFINIEGKDKVIDIMNSEYKYLSYFSSIFNSIIK